MTYAQGQIHGFGFGKTLRRESKTRQKEYRHLPDLQGSIRQQPTRHLSPRAGRWQCKIVHHVYQVVPLSMEGNSRLSPCECGAVCASAIMTLLREDIHQLMDGGVSALHVASF